MFERKYKGELVKCSCDTCIHGRDSHGNKCRYEPKSDRKISIMSGSIMGCNKFYDNDLCPDNMHEMGCW